LPPTFRLLPERSRCDADVFASLLKCLSAETLPGLCRDTALFGKINGHPELAQIMLKVLFEETEPIMILELTDYASAHTGALDNILDLAETVIVDKLGQVVVEASSVVELVARVRKFGKFRTHPVLRERALTQCGGDLAPVLVEVLTADGGPFDEGLTEMAFAKCKSTLIPALY